MSRNASSQPSGTGLYCLDLRAAGKGERQDPPSTLLVRFASSAAMVRPASKCRIGEDRTGNRVLDIDTDRVGIMLTIRSIQCTTANLCTVEGGYYEANLSASGNTYIVERKNGSWRITQDQLNVIS